MALVVVIGWGLAVCVWHWGGSALSGSERVLHMNALNSTREKMESALKGGKCFAACQYAQSRVNRRLCIN